MKLLGLHSLYVYAKKVPVSCLLEHNALQVIRGIFTVELTGSQTVARWAKKEMQPVRKNETDFTKMFLEFQKINFGLHFYVAVKFS